MLECIISIGRSAGMLESYSEINRIAEMAISVDHFATTKLHKIDEAWSVAQAKAWMDVHDIDVAPIEINANPRIVLRIDLEACSQEGKASRLGKEVNPQQIVSRSTSLRDALALLSEHEWLLVYESGNLYGIVTRHDAAKPAISLYVFARLILLEHGLRRLASSYTGDMFPEAPPRSKHESSPSSLSDIIKRVEDSASLRRDLGLDSKGKFSKKLGFIPELRNDLAHSRGIVNSDCDAKKALSRIQRLEDLLSSVNDLVANRSDVWEAYGKTNILSLGSAAVVLAGHGAGPLPMPSPIHIITACNPYERYTSDEVNQRKNKGLECLLLLKVKDVCHVEGRSPDGNWSEPSFAVYGLTRKEVADLANQIGQRAIFELTETEIIVVSVEGEVKARRSRFE